MTMKIIDEGMLTTVQDLGRNGFQQYGVVASGVMDEIAARTANSLLGNEENDAVLEITLLGPTIQFQGNQLIAICGADLSAKINGKLVPLWKPIYVKEGSILYFGRPQQGCRAYLAIAGGIDVPLVMNSRSTFIRAGIGGYEGRAIRKGDVLEQRKKTNRHTLILMQFLNGQIGSNIFQTVKWTISTHLKPSYKRDPVIRFIKGPQHDYLSERSRRQLLNDAYLVSPHSDRMGYRLSATPLELYKQNDLLSEAVPMGTIQVPNDGQPIILMSDRQTIGGYPKIGYIASVDFPVLAQVLPGGKLTFREIALHEAQSLLLEREKQLSELKIGITMALRSLKNA